MDKRLTALLAALLLAAALVACTGGGDEPPPPDSVAADRAALVALYGATGGDYSWHRITNWLTDTPLGEWYGVTTDGDGRVTELDLDIGLTGPIPPELGSLTRLERLVLGRGRPAEEGAPANRLFGPIPPELGMLANLQVLSLGYNELTGSIRLSSASWPTSSH